MSEAPTPLFFDVANWFWIVAGDESQLWSSAAGGYLLPDDSSALAWSESGGVATRIASEFELDQVLRQYGRSLGRAFSPEEALAALHFIDADKVKDALGRDDIDAIVDGDAEKLQALAILLKPRDAETAPTIEAA